MSVFWYVIIVIRLKVAGQELWASPPGDRPEKKEDGLIIMLKFRFLINFRLARVKI